VLPPLRPEQPL